MTKLSFLITSAALVPAALLFSCATDNGDAVHGPQFGPTPERPDGSADGPDPVEGGPGPTDGATEAVPDADASPACTSGTVAVLAGSSGALTGSIQDKGGAWSGMTIAGGAALSPPTLTAFGSGFVGLTRGPSNGLQSVSYGTSWSAPAAIGSLTTLGTPALTIVGAKAHSVFLSGAPDTNKFFRLETTGTTWAATTEPLTGPTTPQSFGPSAGTIAAAGTDLVFAQDGDNEGLYVQTWNGTWSDAVPINGAGTLKTAPPALLAIDGKFDLVLLYADNTVTHGIRYATRDSTTKAWSNAQVTQATAQTPEQMSVARISQFVILVSFIGNNQRPYYMTGTLGASSISWSMPAPLLADTSTVYAAPAVAKGVCGDDAIAFFAGSAAGQVSATRYRGTGWTLPEPVTGAVGGRVSVATR